VNFEPLTDQGLGVILKRRRERKIGRPTGKKKIETEEKGTTSVGAIESKKGMRGVEKREYKGFSLTQGAENPTNQFLREGDKL